MTVWVVPMKKCPFYSARAKQLIFQLRVSFVLEPLGPGWTLNICVDLVLI